MLKGSEAMPNSLTSTRNIWNIYFKYVARNIHMGIFLDTESDS